MCLGYFWPSVFLYNFSEYIWLSPSKQLSLFIRNALNLQINLTGIFKCPLIHEHAYSSLKLDFPSSSSMMFCGLVLINFVLLSSDKAMAPHSSTLAWKLPWTEEPGRLQPMGSLRVRHNWATSLSLFTFTHWRRNGNPLQYSCLENPRNGGAWWAAVYGVAQSRTRLKWLGRHCYHKIVSSVQSLSRVQLFATPWTTARQASLSIIK